MVGDSMFIFGGVATGGANDITVFGDLWQYRFDVNQWREVCCAHSLPRLPSPLRLFVRSRQVMRGLTSA